MNDETRRLLFDVAGRLQKSIVARDCPAIVALQGKVTFVLSDYDYLRDDPTAAAFERRAAAKAHEVDAARWVFAVPQVWVISPDKVQARAVSNHALRDDEHEAITWMSFDLADGVDYGRVPYSRRPNGQPIFGESEMFTAAVHPREHMPGYILLNAFFDERGHE